MPSLKNHIIKLIFGLAALSAVFLHPEIGAQEMQQMSDMPIHEVYIAPEAGQQALETIATSPPQDMNEQMPAQTEPEAPSCKEYCVCSLNLFSTKTFFKIT